MLGPIILQPGDQMIWTPRQGLEVYDGQLRLKQSKMRMAATPSIRWRPFYPTASLAGLITLNNQTQFWTYMGKVKRGGLTSVSVLYRVTTAGVTKTAAQVAIGIGSNFGFGGPTIGTPGVVTIVGFADTTDFETLGQRVTTCNVHSDYGSFLPEGEELWICFYSHYSTQTVLRGMNVGDPLQTGYTGLFVPGGSVPPSAWKGKDIPIARDAAAAQRPWLVIQENG
jgi:hypothetical protein